MKLETLVKILICVLVLNLVFTGMNYFKSDPITVTKSDIKNLLDTQKTTIELNETNNIRNESFKIMDNVRILLGDTSKWDSLRTATFGL